MVLRAAPRTTSAESGCLEPSRKLFRDPVRPIGLCEISGNEDVSASPCRASSIAASNPSILPPARSTIAA